MDDILEQAADVVALAVQTVATTAALGAHRAEDVRASLDTIRATGLAFGCSWLNVCADIRASVVPGHLAILDAATVALPAREPLALQDASRCQ